MAFIVPQQEAARIRVAQGNTMIGPYVNGAALVAGTVFGVLLGPKLNHNLRMRMLANLTNQGLAVGIGHPILRLNLLVLSNVRFEALV